MLALVMSGGANLGALQVGALEVLFKKGFRPEMTIGTSAGSLNAIVLAADPTIHGVATLERIWRSVTPKEIGRVTLLNGLQRIASGKSSLVPDEALAQFIKESLPSVETFGELRKLHGVHTYAAAIRMETSEIVFFGDRDEDRIIDGAMASCAMTPFLPPWRIGEYRYLDGGYITKLPILAAIERGATQIVALISGDNIDVLAKKAHSILGIAQYASALMIRHQIRTEIEQAEQTGIPIRVIHLTSPPNSRVWDYSRAGQLIRLGRRSTQRDLEENPLRIYPLWKRLFRILGTTPKKDK